MPELLRSATLTVQHEIELPMGPPIVVTGRDPDGKVVCQVALNATGITVSGPKGGVIRDMNWEKLVELVRNA
jgi:hypothetical protein